MTRPEASTGATAALGLVLVATSLFAVMNLLARLATTSASWASVAAARSIMGALVALAVARSRGVSLAPVNPRIVLYRSVLGTIAMLSTFYALSSRTVSLGDTVTLLNLAPVFLAVLAPIFLRERTAPVAAIAIGIALAGVVLVVRPAFLFGGQAAVASAIGPSVTTTIVSATFAAFTSSITMMLLRHVGRTERPEAIAFHFSAFAAVIMTFITFFDWRAPTFRDLVFMISAGLCAGFAQLAMTRAYAIELAARVGGMSYLSVVASSLLGVIFLGERPAATAIIGMVLVIAGGVLATFARSRRDTPVT